MDLLKTIAKLTALPISDRLQIVEKLWDSIDDAEPIAFSPEHQAEIDRRLDAHEANPNELLTWDEVYTRALAPSEPPGAKTSRSG